VRNKWLTGEAIALHVGAFLIVGVMLALGWWQLGRAIGGHTRSWAYAIQWPAFAAYAGYLWWKLLHDQPAFVRDREARAAAEQTPEAASADRKSVV